MIKFLTKYKYTSLIAGALVLAVVSGMCGAFIHKKYTYQAVLLADWRQSAESFSIGSIAGLKILSDQERKDFPEKLRSALKAL